MRPMLMETVYMYSMFAVLLIGHYGVNNKVRSKALVGFSLTFIFLIIFVIAGFRTGIGDTYFYKHSYTIVGNYLTAGNTEAIQQLFADEIGFNALLVLLNYISRDPQLLVIVLAFITNGLNLSAIYKYSRPFELGIFLYFATVIFYVTMNGMRQALVASLFFWGIQFILKKKWMPYFCMAFILCLFHTSAVILIPVYFLGYFKAWGKMYWAIAGFFLAATTCFKPIMPKVVELLEGGRFDAYAQDMAGGADGVNIIRIAVMFVPLILAYVVKDELREQWAESDFFLFMSLLNCGFMLLGGQYLYFYRVCIYFELFNLALLPRIIGCMKERLARLTYVYLVVCYSLFCYYQVAGPAWGGLRFSNILFN